MAKLQPLHPGLGQLVMGSRPYTALGTTGCSTGRGRAGGGSRQIHTDRARPATSHPGKELILEQVEPLIYGRLASIQSAFMGADPDGTGLVSKEEFKRVLKSRLSISQNQLDTVLNEVCEGNGAMVDYTQFLRRFSRAHAARRACSSSVRRGAQNTSMSLSEIQKHLKDKIGGNLRTMIRVFHLFDYNRDGHIQQQDFRRILDNYCICLTDKEFHRLWNHDSPNNVAIISYELFLDRLGFDGSHNFKIAPVCTKLELSSRGTTLREKQRKQRPESQISLCNVPSVLPHRKLQTLFYDKMCMNSTPVWQALQAVDTTCSGLVKQDVLRAILSSFVFPMNPLSFQKLTSCYGVRATGPVRWKHFLGHFMSLVSEEGGACLHSDRASEQPVPDEDNFDFHNIYPHLQALFHPLVTKEAGCITRADLQHFLESPGRIQPGSSQPCLPRSHVTELLSVLDPEHTGIIQLASLERFNPNITSFHTANIAPSPTPVNTAEPLDVPEVTEDSAEEGKQPDKKQTTQWADKVSVASALWRTVESLLLDKLCEQLSSVLAALKRSDPESTGYVTQEDLKKVLSCYGMPISDIHFKKLCMPSSSSGPGSFSTLVSYRDFLRNLGVPLTDVTNISSSCCSHKKTYHTERLCTSPQSTLQSVRRQWPPSNRQVALDACNILGIVFRKMRSRLEQRHISLSERMQAILQRADESDKTLSEADVRKILEDSWVILDDEHFSKFTELLGFRDGWIERSEFQVKYEEVTARDGLQGSEVNALLTSAEQCLVAMKTRIKIIHGDNLTAFRLMDKRHRGVVNCHDFKALYNSLGFCCKEEEYQRLLDLIGLQPGGNLNYLEFVSVVENDGKQKQGTQTASIQQQLHDLLTCEAHYKWADMSKVLCQFDTDGQGWIYKKSLRGLLFTYALAIRPEEFEQLWSRYDPEGRGCVVVCDFLERLGIHHDEVLRSRSQNLDQAIAQQDADTPASSDAASLEHIKLVLQENYKNLSDALNQTARDGTVTVGELLSLLNTYSCSIQREQLINHLHRLKVSTNDNCRRLACLDFLFAFHHRPEKKCEPPPVSPDAVRHMESLDSLPPSMALAKLRELASVSAPNLYKAFSAFDQSGTGVVRPLEFRRVVENFCARLSEKQYRYILTKLDLDGENCTVNWKDFLSKFQSQDPLILERTPRGSREQGNKIRPPVQTKPSGITELLQQIQEVVSGHLHEITKELMALDPSNNATVSKEQFRQLCHHLCLRFTDDQFECVWRQMPVNEQRKLQYREFLTRFGAPCRTPHTELSPELGETKPHCSDTEGAVLQRIKSAPQCSSRRPASVVRLGTGSPPGSMERRLRGAVQRCWKEIERNCAELDLQQEGHISTASFLEILQSLNISMTPEQFKHLAGKSDITNNDRVSYHNFLQHFLLNLKPAEIKRAFERRKLPLPRTPTSAGVLSKDCVEVMLRIYESVRKSWTPIRRCFLTSDRNRTGNVTVQDFRKVLRHFSVSLSEEEFFHLSSYFDATTTGKVCYDNFLWAFLH